MSEEIEIIPEQVLVKRHIYPRYATRVCEGSGDEDKPVFRSAIREPRLLAGSIASPSALAEFTDHLPFYRQEKRFERIGIHISRQDCRDRSSGFALRYDPVYVELDHAGSQKAECP